jgi:CrcB protein
VAFGGAIGASLRFFINNVAVQVFGKSFPFGTLSVNIIGSFLFAIIYSLIERGLIQEVPWRALVMVGLLGAFTTFSTFSFDTIALLQQGAWVKSLINILMNVICCLLATWLGLQLFKG